jgi:hypothetical protein
MKQALLLVFLRRKQVLVHEINMPEPSLLAETPEANGFHDIPDWPAGRRQKSWPEIHTAETSFQRMRREKPHRSTSQEIGGNLIELIQKHLICLTDPLAFLQGL